MRKEICGFGALLIMQCGSIYAQPGEVTYIYTDPQGTPLAEADANGNVKATFDYRPYGSIAAGSAPDGPGYTGHANDPDTGLIYMQARFYDPVMARFLSIDRVRPKPGDVYYMNDYAYVGNNPITRIDPTGNYICNGSDKDCAAISGALQDVKSAASKFSEGSKQAQALSKVIAFYGKEGEKNGVTVAFGDADGNNAMTLTEGKETTITFNLQNIRETGGAPGASYKVELAATVTHEGVHGVDGQFFGRPQTKPQSQATETRAFTSQSFINQAYDVTSPYHVWERGWSDAPVTDAMRDSAAEFNADYTVYGRARK